MASEGGFFAFVDILKDLPPLPKIIVFVGLVILLYGIFTGPLSPLHNDRTSAGIAVIALGWARREWQLVFSSINGQRLVWWEKLFACAMWCAVAVVSFYIAHRA